MSSEQLKVSETYLIYTILSSNTTIHNIFMHRSFWRHVLSGMWRLIIKKFYSDSVGQHSSDGDEYIPSAAESSDTETRHADDGVLETSISRNETKKKNTSLLDITLGANKPGASAPDDTELTVPTSKNATSTNNISVSTARNFRRNWRAI